MTTKKWYEKLTGQDLMAAAASWDDSTWQRMDMVALNACARVMADRTTDPDLRAQALEVHTIMMVHLWNRLCRDRADRPNIPAVEVE
jgi:hypothetical protein